MNEKNTTASITDLKKDPMGTFMSGNGDSVEILNRGKTAFYLVPPDVFALLVGAYQADEDRDLVAICKERIGRNEENVPATINADGQVVFS